MELLATHVIAHHTGEKRLQLYRGDLTQIPAHEHVDLLVLSAFPDDYVPTATSLIGALDRTGLSVAELARDKELDLRSSFSSWLSRDLTASFPAAGFRRILCFETSRRAAPPESVGDIFRAMMPFALGDPPIRSIAMPVLASGNQRHDPALMLKAIFEASTHWLAAGLPLNTVKLVIYERESAARLRDVFAQLSAVVARQSAGTPRTPARAKAQYHYFVSYAHDDTEEVDTLVRELKTLNSGLGVFQDKLELNVGEAWQAELDRALETCTAVVAVYSPAYFRSKMCLEEFNMARLRHRESETPVLKPVYLRGVESLPLYMRTLQYIDCREADRARIAAAARELVAAASVSC